MAEPKELVEYQSDHDLLVGLARDVAHLTTDVGKLNEAVTKKNEDHESRIRDLEQKTNEREASDRTWRFVTTTAMSIFGLLITILGIAVTFIH